MDLSILEGWSGPPGTLIDLLFEAGDLLPELLYLVLEVPLPASHPRVAGLQGVAEAVGPAHGPAAAEPQGRAEPAHGGVARGAGGWGGGKGADGEPADRADGRAQKESCRTFGHG